MNYPTNNDETNSTCADKITFDARDQAEAAKIQAQHTYADSKLRVYRCRQCQLFHLASAD